MVRKAKFFTIAALLVATPLCCLAIKSNDFTRASAVGGKRYNPGATNDFGDKKSAFGDKKLDSKQYYDAAKKANLGEERSRWSGASSNIDISSRAYGASKMFNVPEYNGETGSWSMGGKKANFANADKNLSKKYRGKIDINKRNSTYQDFIKDYYGELVERSMEDINKYYSRTSTGSNDKFLQKAAGKLQGDEEEGFFDFLFSDEKVKRRPVSFKGVDSSSVSVRKSGEASTKSKGEFLDSEKMSATRSSSQPAIRPTNNARIDDGVKETTIDADTAKGLDFLKVPEQFRTKATIKVKVKD